MEMNRREKAELLQKSIDRKKAEIEKLTDDVEYMQSGLYALEQSEPDEPAIDEG